MTLGVTTPSAAQPDLQGAVELSNGTKVAQNPSLSKLNLTNAQREQIRKAVLAEDNEVQFRLKATKPRTLTPLLARRFQKESRESPCQRRFCRKYRSCATTCT
jgi:hypothetical protein